MPAICNQLLLNSWRVLLNKTTFRTWKDGRKKEDMQKQIERDMQTQGNNKMIEEKDVQKKNRFFFNEKQEWVSTIFSPKPLALRVHTCVLNNNKAFRDFVLTSRMALWWASSLHQLRIIIMWKIMFINVLEHLYSNIQHVTINKW